MSDMLGWVPLFAGIEDGVNPCMLMTASLVLLALLWFKRFGIKKFWFLYLMVVIITNSFLLNCGVFDRIISNQFFQLIARWIYIFLSLYTGFIAIKFLYEWYGFVKGKEVKVNKFIEIKISPYFLALIVFLFGFLVSLIASVWPTNYYIIVLSMYLTSPFQSLTVMLFILLYTLITFWVVYFVIWFSCLETKNQRLFRIIAAALLLSASISVIDIFLMKGYGS
jgi:hypothetical protein